MSPPDHRAHLTSPFPGHYEFDRILTEAGGESSVPMCALGMIGYDHVPFQSVSTVTPCLGVGQALAWSDWLRDRWADLQGLIGLIWTVLGTLTWNWWTLVTTTPIHPHPPSSISQHLMTFHGLRGRLHQDPVLQLIVAAARSRRDPREPTIIGFFYENERCLKLIEAWWILGCSDTLVVSLNLNIMWVREPIMTQSDLASPKTSPGFGTAWHFVLNLHSDFFFPYSTAFFQDSLPMLRASPTNLICIRHTAPWKTRCVKLSDTKMTGSTTNTPSFDKHP